MAGFEVSRALDASPAQIYTIIADTTTWSEWFMLHESFAEAPPEHITVNSRMVQNIRMLGMSQRIELTATAFKPPMQLIISGRSPAGVSCEFSFAIERKPGGCQLTIAGAFSGAVLTGQLEQAVQREAQTQLVASIGKLAALSDVPA
ncbi:type II toxin-antitoxin system Rv0910 family toxin [Nocardia farcinica]